MLKKAKNTLDNKMWNDLQYCILLEIVYRKISFEDIIHSYNAYRFLRRVKSVSTSFLEFPMGRIKACELLSQPSSQG
jgi:hypothetical protein